MQSHTEEAKKELSLFHDKWIKFISDSINLMKNSNGKIFPLDMIIYGIIKRIISTSSALELLINNFNLTCARSILRMQIDSACRLSAFWLSSDPQDMAQKVLAGSQINHFKDRSNVKMTDSYLVNTLSNDYKWIKQVYKQTSGYIHLSGQHFISSIKSHDPNTNSLLLEFSDEDFVEADSSWIELLHCSSECIDIVYKYMIGYDTTKEIT